MRRVAVRAIITKNNKLLLVKLKSHGKPIDFYCTIGGGLDEGESLIEGIKREVLEETGVVAKVGKLLCIQQYADKNDNIEFFFHVTNTEDFKNININHTWQDYIRELRLEITCGEAPFMVGRYNPNAHTGTKIQLYLKDGKQNRVGFLDHKLYVVNKYCTKHTDWFFWAKEAFKASYGYEWQGDNILIARENLLYTFIDFYLHQFGKKPSLKLKTEIAEIISWNIFQMDGIKYVIPMSCKHETKITHGKVSFFEGEEPDIVEEYECEGCKFNRPDKHNGKYVKIMDWEKGKPIKFVGLLK